MTRQHAAIDTYGTQWRGCCLFQVHQLQLISAGPVLRLDCMPAPAAKWRHGYLCLQCVNAERRAPAELEAPKQVAVA